MPVTEKGGLSSGGEWENQLARDCGTTQLGVRGRGSKDILALGPQEKFPSCSHLSLHTSRMG